MKSEERKAVEDPYVRNPGTALGWKQVEHLRNVTVGYKSNPLPYSWR